MDSSGQVLRNFPFPNSNAGLTKLTDNFTKLGIETSNIEICLEATGHYWLPLYCHLVDLDYHVCLINPLQSDSMRNVYIRRTKTDEKDAYILADLIRFGKAQESKVASEPVLKLQSLTRMRSALVGQISSIKLRVIGVLDRIFPEYHTCFKDIFSITSRELLKNHPTPEDIATVDLGQLTEFLYKISRGQCKEERAKQIQELARGTFGISMAREVFAMQIRHLVEQIEFNMDHLKEINLAIESAMGEFRPAPSEENPKGQHYIETIPGIGPVTAAVIISEIGDISRFKSAKALVAYAGIDSTVVQSGKHEGTRNKVSKRGSPYLREALWLAASAAIMRNPDVSEYYHKRKAEGKHHGTVVITIARKLTHVIYSVWKNETFFDPQYTWVPGGDAKKLS